MELLFSARFFVLLNMVKYYLLVVCILRQQKHDHANCFDMAYKTIHLVFVSNLKLFGPTKTEF